MVAPSIHLVHFNQSNLGISPQELTTRAYVTEKGYELISNDALEIRPMGDIGDGLFAKTAIPKGKVVAVHGGIISRSYAGEIPKGIKIYGRGCTNKSLLPDSFNAAEYQKTSIHGDGSCAADKVQHAFDDSLDTATMFDQKPGKKAAKPNVTCVSLETGYVFDLMMLVAERDINPGEILLVNYGSGYVFNSEHNMNNLAIFDKQGKIIARYVIDHNNRKFTYTSKFLDCLRSWGHTFEKHESRDNTISRPANLSSIKLFKEISSAPKQSDNKMTCVLS